MAADHVGDKGKVLWRRPREPTAAYWFGQGIALVAALLAAQVLLRVLFQAFGRRISGPVSSPCPAAFCCCSG